MTLKDRYDQFVRMIIDRTTGNGLMQMENTAEGERYITPGMPELIRTCGEEGIVLLENDGVLPLAPGKKVSVFGRCQCDWFYVGYGSGGDVHPPRRAEFMDSLKEAGIEVNEKLAAIYDAWTKLPEHVADHGWWGHWPYCYEEMPLTEALVKEAAMATDTAIVVIGRAAGEDRENNLEPGSFYLTDPEKDMLDKVTLSFDKVVLLMDCGNIVDMSFVEKYHFSAVVYVWQLGQESGDAVASVLSGRVNPSGKLADTIARNYEDYPSSAYFGNREYNAYVEDIFVGYRYFETFNKDAVLYPFGYGLSYTTFDMRVDAFSHGAAGTDITVTVKNTGAVAGKEVVQVYLNAPQGKLPKAARSLVAFAKTDLLAPEQEQTLVLHADDEACASFDESGEAGFYQAFMLEPGEYRFFVGNSVRATLSAGCFAVSAPTLVRQCESVCAVQKEHRFSVMTPQNGAEKTSLEASVEMRPVAVSGRDLRQRILDHMPEELAVTGDRGIKLADVKSGKNTLDEFVAQLSDRELGDLSRGEGCMNSALGIGGNAGAFGGITKELRAKGIPALVTADGPAGLRLKKFTSLLPCGTSLACTWNMPLVEALFEKEGDEAVHFNVDVILSPGLNIHRNPLCGRNFEYYSEDPLLSGKTAAAAVRGIQSAGVSACPKHFACNNQEVNRNQNDSRVSERALREIYLKNFEICVKESNPRNIMTSYNLVNGVWSHYNYDLATTILRQEWGYEGNVMTDWWMQKSDSPEFPGVADNAYRVRAQVDVLMPGGPSFNKQRYRFDKAQLETLGKPDGLTRAELQRTAKNVLKFALTRM